MVGEFARLMSRQVEWAHRYNGYARLASAPEKLAEILEPAWREYRRTKRVPEWCGFDLLRGWAFYLARADRHGGGYGLMENGDMIDEWRAVLERITSHEEATPDEMPTVA